MEVKYDWYSFDNLVRFQRYEFGSIRTFESRSKRFNIAFAKFIELAQFSHHFVRTTLVREIRAENGDIFQSHLDGSQNHFELGRIRGSDFRLAIEGNFDCYSLEKPCLVSTICIWEYANVWPSFQTVQYWTCEMHRISAVFASFCTYDFDLQN
jgi:hypothetical protein